ncbi:MAG TPA: cyclic nucleotide-binding domain-containing protein [Jatrophihabitantaceae bacterium]|jgi:CRP-like cAMP-binding protein
MNTSDSGRPHPTPEQLASVPLLASLDREQLKDLAELFEVAEVPAGLPIVSEGAPGYAFYVLAEGTAEVQRRGNVVRTLGPSDYFGEIAMIENTPRTAWVLAVEPCVVWMMFGNAFRTLETGHPEVAKVLQDAADARRG